MIILTKLDDSSIMLNIETIKYIETIPDTLVFFLNGDSVIVKESLTEILEKYVKHKASVMKQVH